MLYDRNGNPVNSLTTEQLAHMVKNDMQNVYNILNILQRGLILSEMKVSFLIGKLTEHGVLNSDTLDTEWQEFARKQEEEMAAQRSLADLNLGSREEANVDLGL